MEDAQKQVCDMFKGKTWLTTGEVATMCGTTTESVRRWINAGRLPAVRFNTVRKILRDDVVKFIKNAETRAVYSKDLKPNIVERVASVV